MPAVQPKLTTDLIFVLVVDVEANQQLSVAFDRHGLQDLVNCSLCLLAGNPLELPAFVIRYCCDGRVIQSGGFPFAASPRVQGDSGRNSTEVAGEALGVLEFRRAELCNCDTERLLQQVASALLISDLADQQVPQAAAVPLDHLGLATRAFLWGSAEPANDAGCGTGFLFQRRVPCRKR